MDIREVFRLRQEGYNDSEIARSAHVARSTIALLLKRLEQSGLDLESVKEIGDDELMNRLYPKRGQRQVRHEEPDFASIQAELAKHGSKVTLKLLHEEYKRTVPHGLEYSQFCERYRQYRARTGIETGEALRYPRQNQPGYAMEADWAGDTPKLVMDLESGIKQKVHLFVASLGCSGYLFARAFPNEKSESWIHGHTAALHYFGRVPRVIVPDNTKTAVSQTHRYEPVIHPEYRAWAQHYRVAITPARVAKPRDKPLAEGSVHWLNIEIFGRLRNEIFTSFELLNQRILEIVNQLNKEPYQKRPGSRQEIFEEQDFPVMRPLPAQRYHHRVLKLARVSRLDYHVQFGKELYSVPFRLVGRQVLVCASDTTVEILYENQRVAIHERATRYQHRRTDPDHMPSGHRAQYDISLRTEEYYVKWGYSRGKSVGLFIERLLQRGPIVEAQYRTCMGVLNMKVSHSALNQACGTALDRGTISLKALTAIVQEMKKQTSSEKAVEHENLRGAEYYAINGREHKKHEAQR